MREIIFVTTNSGKVASLQKRLNDRYVIRHKELELEEIQAHSCEKVSEYKAKIAFSILKMPLIVQDSSFHINALNGFPGVYAKYIHETIQSDGMIKLMKGVEDRSCYFLGALTYIDKDNLKTFVSEKNIGRIALKKDDFEDPVAWSDLWKIFIPKNEELTLSQLARTNTPHKKSDRISEFDLFAKWLNEMQN